MWTGQTTVSQTVLSSTNHKILSRPLRLSEASALPRGWVECWKDLGAFLEGFAIKPDRQPE